MSFERVMGEEALRVVKDSTVQKVDEPTFVRLNGVSQQSGIRMSAILNAPVLNTSAIPELALLEVAVHLNPQFIPSFHLLVLDIPHSFRAVSLADLPQNWQEERPNESLAFHLLD